ncbi:MAG: serine/threonine-protein kinase [Elusimicrobiota bacterium]
MRLPVALALLILACPVQAADEKELLTKEIAQVQAELEPLAARLAEFTSRYPALTDLGPIEAERSQLRRDLEQKDAQMRELKLRFRAMSTVEYLPALKGLLVSGKKPGNLDVLMETATADDRFYRAGGALLMPPRQYLEADQRAFEEARKALEWRRFMRRAGLLSGSLLALAAAWIFWAFRRRAAVQAPAALSAPALALQSGPASLSPGSVLGGNFQIERELGRGGLGVVYEALDLTLQRKVAIKRLREELCRSRKELEAFLAEARVVAALKHPHVAEIHGVLREGDQVFLVFERAAGQPLDQLLEERGKLDLGAVKGLLAQVGAALDYAHGLKVLHRSLKPSNILVTEAGAAKVTDFGLSHRAQATAARTSGNAGCTTDPYMAPEQELGTASREADLYALGACVYEMAVGRPPFPGPDFLAQKRGMRYDPPSQAAGLSAGFDAFIQKALQPDPGKRFRSAAEMAAAAGALALWMAFVPAAVWPQSGSGEKRYASVQEAQDDLQRMTEELEPLAAKLASLKSRYPLLKDLAEVDPERTRLRGEIERRKLEMDQVTLTFNRLRRMDHTEAFKKLIADKESMDLNAGIARVVGLEEFYKRNQTFRGDVLKALDEDAAAYSSAAEAIRRKRMMNRGVVIVIAAQVLLLAVGLLLRRRYVRRTMVPEVVSRSGPAAALSQPGSAAAALSAPITIPPGAVSAPCLPAPAALACDSVIGGNFRIVRELGRGGMGVVYEGLDVTLQRKVAIKKMREELCQSPKELEMFLSEARLVAALQHPNVVKIHGVVHEGGQVYLVFEHVSGRPLSRVVEDFGKLPLRTVKGLLAHVAAALDYAHTQRVIHRDLKSSNIMVTNEKIVKVMDFGLAHQVKVTAARATRAETWGTPAYMAPEQELGSVSRESDLYSLGVCVYEAATGKLPFNGPNFLAQKREMHYVPPSQAAGLSPGFDAVIRKALAPEPGGRFHSGAEMLAAVAALDALPQAPG